MARQAPLSMGFSRQEYWSGFPYPPSEDLLDPGIKPTTLMSPALAGGFFTTSATWEVLLPPVMNSYVTSTGQGGFFYFTRYWISGSWHTAGIQKVVAEWMNMWLELWALMPVYLHWKPGSIHMWWRWKLLDVSVLWFLLLWNEDTTITLWCLLWGSNGLIH